MPKSTLKTTELTNDDLQRGKMALAAMKAGIGLMLKSVRGQFYFGKNATVSIDIKTGDIVITSKDKTYRIKFA